ncbi:MAG TPA: ATP-binding protein, partial [Bacteroidales bacterium]
FYFSSYSIPEILFLSTGFIVFILLVLKFVHEVRSINFVKQLLHILLFAAFTTIIINIDVRQKKDEHQKLSSVLLTRESDKELENLFLEAYPKILNDTVFASLLKNSDNNDKAIDYLISTYFFEIRNSYTIQAMLCSPGEMLKIQPEGFITECSDYFGLLIENYGKPSIDSTLFLINGETESIYYLGKFEMENEQTKDKEIVYLEFFSSIVPEGFGYTELLIDKKSDSVDLTGYSFAWYQSGELVYKFGNFPYQTNFTFLKKYEDGVFFEILGYRTLKIQISPEKYFIISRPSQQLTEQLATFSILFIVFGSIMLLAFLVVYRRKAGSIFTLNFRIRLQFFFIGTISLIIVLFAIITFYYLENNNANRLKSELNEKTQSVIIELQHKLSTSDYIKNVDEENLYQLLSKFSMVFFSDINLYDASGKLIASSRPEIFSRGLQSTQINPTAFNELSKENQLYFLTKENIGNISYYSSYAPLILGDNQLVGFVNLPYFARQFDAERSYLLMFSTFINLFVILGIIGTLLALLLSKLLIKPLVVLQNSLATIQIEKPNTKISWNIDDEIGLLIKEYNKMIDKLEQSAILLKHSERESAWREVARQIAHEIKNPLTPMKLNVQYLEKAYLENDPKFDEKIGNISASLVMQIDTLDKVAEMFSDFANKKSGNFEKVNLLETVNSCVSLFRNNTRVEISVNATDKNESYFILAFEKDMLRVFNNLIKNSIQSTEGNPSGRVEIVFEGDENYITIQVIDNGKGIADSEKASIFQPYFTTKTGGTGLGLAIVKNIVSEISGEISFESSQEKGTRFILKFKRFKENSI